MTFRTTATLLAVLAAAACNPGGKTNATSDPNRPAVVQGPPIVLPSDTAHPDTMPAYRDRMEELKSHMSEWHGYSDAMAVFGKRGALLGLYAPEATLRIGDTTFSGALQIANGLVDLAYRTSIRELSRAPRSVNATDSVAVDTGTYAIVMQRAGGSQTEQRGTYVTTWKRSSDPKQPWLILRDELMRDPTGKVGKPRDPSARGGKSTSRGKNG